MIIKKKIKWFLPIGIFLFCISSLIAYGGDVTGDMYRGGLIWNNWTKTFAGGSGELPSGVANKDFIRCKACHGWDALGPDGGYVRRSGYPDKTSRPKPIAGTNLKNYFGKITSRMVKYEKGREWSIEDNRMPNFTQSGGLTEQQVADVVAFLNNGPKITDVATLDINTKPVKYIFLNDNIANGQKLYADICQSCHGTDGKGWDIGRENGIIDYFRSDGKYSEGFIKMIYGADSVMSREAQGNLTVKQARDILSWIQTKADDPDKTGLDD